MGPDRERVSGRVQVADGNVGRSRHEDARRFDARGQDVYKILAAFISDGWLDALDSMGGRCVLDLNTVPEDPELLWLLEDGQALARNDWSYARR